MLYKFDLTAHPLLGIQRDIFIFQCQIGCRVGDLYDFTYSNIVGGVLHYIAGKTKEDNPVTLTVPLTTTAKELIEKYKGRGNDNRLFPFISEKCYNEDIKAVFKLAELTRNVVTLDSVSGDPVIRTLDQEASSHMARRTFIGNLFKKSKNSSIIGSMTGHVEGSKSFARYREIDEEIKKDILDLME